MLFWTLNHIELLLQFATCFYWRNHMLPQKKLMQNTMQYCQLHHLVKIWGYMVALHIQKLQVCNPGGLTIQSQVPSIALKQHRSTKNIFFRDLLHSYFCVLLNPLTTNSMTTWWNIKRNKDQWKNRNMKTDNRVVYRTSSLWLRSKPNKCAWSSVSKSETNTSCTYHIMPSSFSF
jgi:hypothetical protein